MALGLGSCRASDARKARAGTSSRIRVGEPCETKIVGMDIALFLVAPVAACVQLGSGNHCMQEKAEIMKVLRTALQALACLALLAAAPAGAQTLKMVAHSDLKVLDPIWTTAFITRNHGYLIYDTLFAKDEQLNIRPQMADNYETPPANLPSPFT